MINKKLTITFLFLLFTAALTLRLYRIDSSVLYADETNGNYWMSYGISQPTANFSLWRKLFFATFTPAWFLGLSPLTARLFSVVFSSLLIPAMFLFSLVVSRHQKLKRPLVISFFASVLIAIAPWSYMIGRIGHTQIPIILLLSLIHTFLYLRAKKFHEYLLCLAPLVLSVLYYQSMLVVGFFAGLIVVVELIKSLDRRYRLRFLLISTVFGSLMLIPINRQYGLFSVASRGFELAIWRDVNTPYDTDKYRALSWNSEPSLFSFGLPPEQLANKLFLNRVTANLSIFTRNYLSFFSPDWLFLKGDAILRHSTGMVGAFYPFLLPFMLYGAFRFFKSADPKTRNLFLVWILVSPIPAAITKDGAGYLLRAVTMLPFLTYFCALGIVDSFSLISKKWRWQYGIVIALIGLYSAWSFFYGYFHVYPALSARAYEYGFKELSDFQSTNNNKIMLVVWDGYYPVGHFLFWQKIPFSEYEKMKVTPIGIGETTFWKTLPNLYFAVPKDTKNVVQFIKDYQPAYLALPDRYFVKYSDDLLKLTAEKVYEIEYPDKTTAFSVYTVR